METKKIHNLIILDASGSMTTIYNQALAGVNETLETIRQAYHDMPEQMQAVTLASFADGGEPLQTIFNNVPINEVRNITRHDYKLRGCTALYDAIGETTSDLERHVMADDKVLVTIITDGEENDSRKWSQRKVKDHVARLRAKGWVFTYIGANQDVVVEASKVGVSNSLKFEATVEGTMEMFETESRARRNWNERVYRGEEDIEERYYESIDDGFDPHRITPSHIDSLEWNEVFVFGSNVRGHHRGGAARAAMKKFGAVYGIASGMQGQSYAIPTVGCSFGYIAQYVQRFIVFAKTNPHLHFYVTPIGCGNAGFAPYQIAPLFRDARDLENVSLPREFLQCL